MEPAEAPMIGAVSTLGDATQAVGVFGAVSTLGDTTQAVGVIGAVSTLGDATQTAGVVAAAVLAATVVLAGSGRARAWAMLGALVLTPVLLVANIWSTPQFEPLRGRPVVLLAGAAGALVVLALGAWAIHRRPELLALAAAAALPFRVPIESGGDTANLLVPLYLVIAAGALAYAAPRLRSSGRRTPDEPERGLLDWLLAGAVVLYAAQAAYSGDFDNALAQVIFFYVPFTLLYALLRRIEWTPQLAGRCLVVLLVLAVAFVGIGFVEYAKRELLLNPKVISSNQFESYFRVNSLFFDPNIYGRFLVVVMLALVAILLWSRRSALVAGSAVALVLLWAGLVLTLSQSSFTALLAGLVVLGGLRWGTMKAVAIVAVFALAGVAVALAAPSAVGLDQSADAATSGRSTLVEGGVELFEERPLQGWGAGAFKSEYRRQQKSSSERASAASHTIPVTVAAEQGAGGLALYLALVAVAIAVLLRGARSSVARAAVAAAFVALVVHTLLYAAFLEDPLVWALLAVGVALPAQAPQPDAAPAGAPPGALAASAP
jgi:O-antigen ligase